MSWITNASMALGSCARVVVVKSVIRIHSFGKVCDMIHEREYTISRTQRASLCRFTPPLALISNTLMNDPFIDISHGPSLITTFGLYNSLAYRILSSLGSEYLREFPKD